MKVDSFKIVFIKKKNKPNIIEIDDESHRSPVELLSRDQSHDQLLADIIMQVAFEIAAPPVDSMMQNRSISTTMI